VGNIQINQTWGTAFLSGQAAQKFPGYYGATEDTGSPGSQWGYAVMAGLNFKLPQLGAGDQLWIEGTWTKGILSRLQGATPFQAFGVYGSSAAGYQSLAFGYALDGIFNASTLSNLELTSGWGIAGGIEHFWVPSKLRSSLFASYSEVSYGANANAWLCSKYGVGFGSNGLNGVITGVPGGAGGAAGAVCDFDFSTWQIGSRSIWTPVAGFDFTAEILYTAIDQNHTGFLNTTGVAPAGLKPQANYELKDQGIISGLLRAQRNF
jgi:hypothetical protein